MISSILFLYFLSSAETTVGPEASTKPNSFYDGNFIVGTLISCFENKDFLSDWDKLKMFQMNVFLMSDSLAREFERNQMSKDEVIGFLAHTLHETFLLKDFVQPVNGDYCKIDVTSTMDGATLNRGRYCKEIDRCNRRAAAQTSADKIGFGLLHSTGCDTIASTIGYLETGEWKNFWEIPMGPRADLSDDEQRACNGLSKEKRYWSRTCYRFETLPRQCNQNQRAQFEKYFRKLLKKDYDRSPKYLGIMNDRTVIANPCATFQVGSQKVSGADLAAKASVGFFMGKCGSLGKGSKRSECINGKKKLGQNQRDDYYTRIRKCSERIPELK